MQQIQGVNVISGENLHLDALGPVLQPAFTIRHAPESDKEESCHWLAFNQILVLEKPRLDIPGSHLATALGL
jgi:hypothetical protein